MTPHWKTRTAVGALCTVMVLAGCTHPTRPPATTTGAGPSAATCGDPLILGWADNGATRCVLVGGVVAIDLRPNGPEYPSLGMTGSALTNVVTPGRPTSTLLGANSPGTAVVTWSKRDCGLTGGSSRCSAWSVTVIVVGSGG